MSSPEKRTFSLPTEQYQIMRKHGTEAPGSCALNFEKRNGTFSCAGCGQPLFTSKKYILLMAIAADVIGPEGVGRYDQVAPPSVLLRKAPFVPAA